MSLVGLKYGNSEFQFSYAEDRFEILNISSGKPPLSDIEIGDALDNPINSERLDDLVSAGDTVLLVVPDITRRTAAGQIANLVVRRLIAAGVLPVDIAAIFATGIHRPVTESEKSEILTPFLARRLRTLDHDPANRIKLFSHGTTESGIPIELNWALSEFDHIVLIGGVTFHYFAGFTGGRKLICPGLASEKTVAETHKLAFDCSTMDRRQGVEPGLLSGNAVHEAFVEAAAKINPAFTINTIVDEHGRTIDLHCGEMNASHLAACEQYGTDNTIYFDEKRDLVIASCGGAPNDINLIQAHKALDAAANACNDGGVIVLAAECSEGLGRADLLDWFELGDSGKMAERLCEKYQVNGQTAWSFRKKAERFDIRMITTLGNDMVEKLGIKKASSIEEAISDLTLSGGYILPNASKGLYLKNA